MCVCVRAILTNARVCLCLTFNSSSFYLIYSQLFLTLPHPFSRFLSHCTSPFSPSLFLFSSPNLALFHTLPLTLSPCFTLTNFLSPLPSLTLPQHFFSLFPNFTSFFRFTSPCFTLPKPLSLFLSVAQSSSPSLLLYLTFSISLSHSTSPCLTSFAVIPHHLILPTALINHWCVCARTSNSLSHPQRVRQGVGTIGE